MSLLASASRPVTPGSRCRWAPRVDAYDNAVAESFFATLKKELVHRQSWPSRRDLSSAVFEYIEAFYNRQRRHSTLGYLSPEEFERGRITTTKTT
jgi:putative transposase